MRKIVFVFLFALCAFGSIANAQQASKKPVVDPLPFTVTGLDESDIRIDSVGVDYSRDYNGAVRFGLRFSLPELPETRVVTVHVIFKDKDGNVLTEKNGKESIGIPRTKTVYKGQKFTGVLLGGGRSVEKNPPVAKFVLSNTHAALVHKKPRVRAFFILSFSFGIREVSFLELIVQVLP